MADVRLLIQEEGRAARNLVAFNVPVGTNNVEKITKKPPSVPRQIQSSSTKRSMKPTTRVRSASTGRDKKSELQARYWAFLFGNLQRAVDGIYQTCDEDENISECKEVILVLENYTRDFHNLIEWFKVKWAYENSAPPLRRTPLAWEVRKTSPCRMWNSTIIPKSTSPLQRSSPTESVCKSPVDQIICENKPIVTDNKVNHAKEEFVHKLLKDSKNNVCKNCSSDIKEKRKNGADKTGNQIANKEKSMSTKTSNKVLVKQTVQSKTNSFVDRRTLIDSVTYDSKNKMDVKNISKQTKDCLHSNIVKLVDSNLSVEKREQTCRSDKNVQLSSCPNCELMQKEYNGVNVKDGKTDGKSMDSKLSYNKNNGLGKNEINTKVKKDSNRKFESNVNAEKLSTKTAIVQSTSEKINQVDCQINKQIGDKSSTKDIQNASSNNIDKNPVIISTDRPAYSTVSQTKRSKEQSSISETPKFVRSKTCLSDKNLSASSKRRPGTSVIVRGRFQTPENKLSEQNTLKKDQNRDMNGSVEVLTKQTVSPKLKDESDGWQTVRNRCRRGSTHNLNMSTRFHKPSTALSLPALSIESPSEKLKKTNYTPDENKQKKKCIVGKTGKNMNNEVEKVKGEYITSTIKSNLEDTLKKNTISLCDTNSTSVIAAIFKNDAELLEKRIQQFMTAQAERERIILEEERKTEEADSQRSQQLSDEEASLKRQILELESTEIDIDTETDETDGEMVLEMEDEPAVPLSVVTDDISLEDRYGNMLEGMSWAERVDTLAQLRALVARHPGRALELHQKLSSPSRKRSLPETLRRYQAKQACAQHKRQKLLMEKSQRLRELLNKVEDVKSAKNQLIEDKRIRMEMKLKRAEENRTQHLLEIVRKAHDEDSKLKEIAFINELEAQNKRHDFMALCQEQEERLQGIQEERQRRQEEKAAKEAAAEERRRALEAERQLRIQKMKQARREREERVGKMQLEREKERQELAREKARDREERLSALHAAQLANQEELQKKIAQKQQESARRHVENIEHIRQRAVESSILRSEEVPPTLKSYPAQKQCSLCGTIISNEVHLLSHLKGKTHLEAVRNAHDNREPSRDELQRFNIAQIRDVPVTVVNNNNANNSKAVKEKQKALKRRCRKIKQRMSSRGQEWEDKYKSETNQNLSVESANKAKFRRNLKELDRLYNNHSKSAWSNIALATLERCLGEIVRAFSKSCPLDQDTFRYLNGFDTLTNLLNLGLNTQNASHILPNKVITSLCRVYKAGVSGNTESTEAILLSNKILVILDLLLQRLETLTSLDDHAQTQDVSANSTGNGTVAASATQLLCSLIPEEPFEKTVLQTRVQDIAGYLVAGSLVDRVSRHSRALIETDFFLDQEHESPLLVSSYDLLARICSHLRRSVDQDTVSVHGESSSGVEQTSNESHLLSTLSTTEASSAIGALYAAVAYTPQNQKGASPTPNQTFTAAVRTLASHGLKLLKSIAELDLRTLQSFLGAEGTSLQWRLIASHLIIRLSRDSLSDKSEVGSMPNTSGIHILSELFVVLGYFSLNNPDNQLVLQSAGAGPSVLQQLCTLPFPFYGDPRLIPYTLPALLAATHHNSEAMAILSCEMSYELLEQYRNSDEGKLNPLVRLLKDTA
ncbi:S phase cyclin A-associated protein in the endoplasmic reticulum [Mycetomoellerius zeteki]|uniref:S phase cyclin A-associated protein in the endoplasmic reticulum n=1 Tax=Mycetomoellerius zeteki TaxID=64791 RepID=UPI00084E9C71|nr:PREDICTED: S phase cyclin A-associated protein in the endoplasmic reticulum [Trachymyrmex zeteki]XP_018304476.1 PREDICTED: S phase cyclin A-associated protein in the endoplasmic reticulum [Trachymyrmex zeteki]XP_018304477.1 PREDICTED: S phase cyclin A-associated protein in the endoplasmic reticulum [Trachymyrmex zeteki]XP_018304478.1 PREDICTED: S phase cyclin A-associated protein in the endoplasmic reticulum [Trachymyrmex zeteki]XP_018304479.1 PREDICTED: S phase cyclin A-associated protein i